MAGNPRVSIIVPALEEAAGIVRTLAPLQAWRACGDEIILVDGGSRDATVVLAARLVDKVVRTSAGRARQMNAGVAASRGEWLLFLHADTLLPVGARDRILEGSGGWGRFDVRLSGTSLMLRIVEWSMNLRSRLTGIATGDQALFMAREFFETLGGFPDQPLMEDIEFSTRARRYGWPRCLRERVITSSRRWERNGIWSTVLLMWTLRFRYWWGASPARLLTRYQRPQR